MRHLFVPYEIAKKLKELGFDEECFAFNDNDGKFFYCKVSQNYEGYVAKDSFVKNSTGYGSTAMPLYQQVIDWFFEKHKIAVMYSPQESIVDIDILRAIESIKK